MLNLESRLQRVKQTLARPPTEKEMKIMAAKKAPAPAAKANAAAAAPAKEPAKKANDENLVTLAEICKEMGITGQAARRKLRAAKLQKEGRWVFEAGSAEEKRVREILAARPAEKDEEEDEEEEDEGDDE